MALRGRPRCGATPGARAPRRAVPLTAARVAARSFAGAMSFTLNAAQFNNSFTPKRLGNWEVPALRDRTPFARPPGFRTVPVVDDKGHLLPEVPKRMTSFSTGYEMTSHKRWPVSLLDPHGGAATMGYKGIQTTYLPSSTIFTRNNPDSVRAALPGEHPPRATRVSSRRDP